MRVMRTPRGMPACSKAAILPRIKADITALTNSGMGFPYLSLNIQVSLASRGSSQTIGKSGGVGMGWPAVGACVLELDILSSFTLNCYKQYISQTPNTHR